MTLTDFDVRLLDFAERAPRALGAREEAIRAADRARAAGFDRHFVKPIQGSDVMDLLAAVESGRQAA